MVALVCAYRNDLDVFKNEISGAAERTFCGVWSER